MKSVPFVFVLISASLVLAGCSSGLLNRKSTVPQAASVPTNGNLALPPDLQLAAPGTAPRRVSQSVEGDTFDTALADPESAPVARAPVTRVPQQDVYEKYGISKLKADGTPKSKEQLAAELKAAVIAEKRRTNPRYGTVGNIGAIFTDE